MRLFKLGVNGAFILRKYGIRVVREEEALPREARRYLARLEELAKCPIDLVSTGSKREETIVLKNPLRRSRSRR